MKLPNNPCIGCKSPNRNTPCQCHKDIQYEAQLATLRAVVEFLRSREYQTIKPNRNIKLARSLTIKTTRELKTFLFTTEEWQELQKLIKEVK